MTFPRTAPGVTLTSAPGVSDAQVIARKLIRTGAFDVPCTANSPIEALRDALVPTGADTDAGLWVGVIDADEDGPALLSVRYRKAAWYSLHTSLKRYDRIRPGLLGGLLNRLRVTARRTAPMFTPYDVLQDAYMNMPFDQRQDTLEEAGYHLRNGQYKHLPASEVNGRLSALSCRDAARMMARDGKQTYLDDHTLGWTLGTPMLSNEELKQEVSKLPADLHARVVRLNHCLERLAVLAARMPENLDDPRFEEFGNTTSAFVVTGGHPDRLAKDALSELFDDIVQQRVHMLDEADSWPLWSVPATSQADYHRASRALIHTARAQRLVHEGLLALGAQKC